MSTLVRSFIAKDVRLFLSYRAALLLQLASIVLAVATYFFLGETVTAELSAPYTNNYFAFVLSGMALSAFLTTAASAQANQIAQEQRGGTLEMIMQAPASGLKLMIALSSWSYLLAVVIAMLYLVVAGLFFNFTIVPKGIPTAALTLVLAFFIFFGLGALASAFVLRFKRGNPVQWFLQAAQVFLGGVYFPLSVFPDWLESVAKLLPLTYCVESFRRSLLLGQSFSQLGSTLLVLILFAVLTLAVGLWVLDRTVKHLRLRGSFVDH